MSRPKSLLVSIHDVSPKHEARIARLEGMLADAGVGARYAMLVVPDFWGEWPLARDPAFQARLRAWADAGVEMWLHGWSHRDDASASSFRHRHMTAGEGEFGGLTQAQAARLLADGRALLEDMLGRAVDRFVAPAWLYSEGAKTALAEAGFRMAEDHFRVWRPDTGAVLARGPVISYASRTRGRMASSLAFSRMATVALSGQRVVRLALHPHDVDQPALVAETRRALSALTRGRTARTYEDALA